MQRNNRVFSLSIKNFSLYFPFILFVVLFLVGILIGNLTVGNFEFIKEYTEETFKSFLEIRKERTWFMILGDASYNVLPVFVLIFLSGTSVIGCICSPLILFSFGLKYGFITGYLYFTYQLDGVMFNCLIMLPCVVITLLGLVILCIESFNFSLIISKVCIRTERTTNVYMHFKNYCIKSSATLISIAVAAICDILLTNLFISFFDF